MPFVSKSHPMDVTISSSQQLNGQYEETQLDVLKQIRDLLLNGVAQPAPPEKEVKPAYDCSPEQLRDMFEPFWIVNNPDSPLPFDGCGVAFTCTERPGDPAEAGVCQVKQHNTCYLILRRHLMEEKVKNFEVTAELMLEMSRQELVMLGSIVKVPGKPTNYNNVDLTAQILEHLPKKLIEIPVTAKAATVKKPTTKKAVEAPAEKKLNAGALRAIKLAEERATQSEKKPEKGKSKSKKK